MYKLIQTASGVKAVKIKGKKIKKQPRSIIVKEEYCSGNFGVDKKGGRV